MRTPAADDGAGRIPPPNEAQLPKRYAPQRAFPAYRYVPGLYPHPTTHPNGHSFGQPEPETTFLPAEEWMLNEEYLFGVDLFNRRYYWEAHEAWETVWHTCNKSSAHGLFIQGLIQISAGLLRWHMGTQRGARKLFRAGREKLQGVIEESPESYMGIRIAAWARDLDVILSQLLETAEPTGPAHLPVIALTFPEKH